MQVKIYISGITVRQARILRYLTHKCGGARCNAIRLIGSHYATYDMDMDGPRAKALALMVLNPPRKWHWAARQCMMSYHP